MFWVRAHAMEPPQKRARKDADAVWDKYWMVVEMKENARLLVEKEAGLHAALAHSVWERVVGVCRLMSELDRRRPPLRRRFQSCTVAELRSSPQAAAARLRAEYDEAATALGVARDTVASMIEGLRMRQSYPDVPDSEEELLEQYERIAKYASCTVAMDRFSMLHTGLRRDFLDGLGRRIEAASGALDHEVEVGCQLKFSAWRMKAMLCTKLENLEALADRCACAIAELDQMLDIAADAQMVASMPQHQCYLCLGTHMFGLTFCSTCPGAVCDGCVQKMVHNACDSGGVSAATNGEVRALCVYQCALVICSCHLW